MKTIGRSRSKYVLKKFEKGTEIRTRSIYECKNTYINQKRGGGDSLKKKTTTAKNIENLAFISRWPKPISALSSNVCLLVQPMNCHRNGKTRFPSEILQMKQCKSEDLHFNVSQLFRT